MSTDPGDSFSFGVGALAVVHEPRPARRSSQVLGDGALLGGCAGAVVGDHARSLPATGKHGFGGAGAAGRQLARKADAPGVPGDSPLDAGAPGAVTLRRRARVPAPGALGGRPAVSTGRRYGCGARWR